MDRLYIVDAAQVLGFMAAAGVVAGLYRWRTAASRPHLLAFIVFLLGTALREAVVHAAAGAPWTDTILMLSGSARLVQILGAVLFVRAVSVPKCGEALWLWVFTGAVFFACIF